MDTDRRNDFLLTYRHYTKEQLENEAISLQNWIKWYQDRFEIVNEFLNEFLLELEKEIGEQNGY